MNNFEDFGANFFSMSYTPCIYQICISKCHVYLEESQNPPVSFLFLRSPSLQSPSLFFWIANLSLTLPPQKIHIFVTIYISSPFSRVIYVAPSLPILKHRYGWSRPIPPVALFSFFQSTPSSISSYFWQSATPPELYPQLTIYISHMFFSDCVLPICQYFSNPNVFFYFVDAGKISTIIKIYNINFDGYTA